MCPELHRPGHVNHYVDLAGAADRERILGDRRSAAPDGVVEYPLGTGRHDFVAARVSVDLKRPFGMPVEDGGHAHSWHAVHDLVGETLPHEPSADHAYTNWRGLFLAGLESLVDDDHDCLPLRLTGSFSA